MTTVDPIKNIKDIEKIKSALHGRDKLLFIIGINTSLRISDLLTLRFDQFANLAHDRRVTVKEGKTGKTKTMYINDSILQALKEATAAAGDIAPGAYLFPSQKGGGAKPISRVQAWRILNAAAERAGLKHINFGTHTMRKTFAYHAYVNNADLATLMKTLNHSSQKETLRYIGIEQAAVNSIYEQLNL